MRKKFGLVKCREHVRFFGQQWRGLPEKGRPKLAWLDAVLYCVLFVFASLVATTPSSAAPPALGLKTWLSADFGITSDINGGVSTWADQSGSGNNGSQVNSGNRPTVVANQLNGLPVLRFNPAATQYLNLPNFLSGASAAEVLVVIRATAVSGTDRGLWYFSTNTFDWYPHNSGVLYDSFGSTAQQTQGRPALDINQTHIYQVSSQAGRWRSWLDGIPVYQTSTNTVAFNTAPTLGRNGYGSGFSGDIAEILVYDRVLTDSERQDASSYLTQKYALRESPAKPANLVAKRLNATQNLVSWNWAQTNNPITFVVERKIGSAGTYTEIARLNGRGSYLDDGVSDEPYYYRVYAISPGGTSFYSDETAISSPMAEGGDVPLSGMKLWLMADGAWESPIGYLADYSGNGNDAWQSTYSQMPTVLPNVLNGKPVIHFNGPVSQFLSLPNLMSGATAGEVVVVLRAAANSGTDRGLWYFGGTIWDWYPHNSGVLYDSFGSTTQQTQGISPVDLTQFRIYEVSSQAGLWQSWIDGVPFYRSSVNTVAFNATPYLGRNGYGSGFLGDMAEIMIYNRPLTEIERKGLAIYLNQKYSLKTIPATPTGLSVRQIAQTQNLLSWNWAQTSGRSVFIVERKTGVGGTFSEIARVNGSGTYLDSSVGPGEYYYRIRAINAYGASDYTEELPAYLAMTEGGGVPPSGLKLWLMADGAWQSPVGYLADYSGSGNDAWQSSGANRPTVASAVLNGKPTLRFNGSQFLTLPNLLSGATAGHVFVVLKAANASANSGLWRFGTYGYGDWYAFSDGTNYDGFGSNNRYSTGALNRSITDFHAYEVCSQAGVWESWLDGIPVFRSSTNVVSFSSAPLLGRNNDGYNFNGDIAEILVYNRPLGEEERLGVQTYLSQKYALNSIPNTPTAVAANSFNGSGALVTWSQPPEGAMTTFQVWRKKGGSAWELAASLENERTYIDAGLDFAANYQYKVRAISVGGVGEFSNAVPLNRSIPITGRMPSIGMKLWMMADGAWVTPLNMWPDYSGNNNDGWQMSGPNRPVLVQNAVNGRPVLRFTGGQYLTLSNLLSGATAGQVFIVLKSASVTANSGLWRFGTLGLGDYYTHSDGKLYNGFGSNTRYDVGSPIANPTQFRLYEVSSQVGRWISLMDGKQQFLSTSNTVSFSTAPLLGRNNENYGFNGDIAEVVIFNRVLSGEEASAVRRYLGIKYLLPGLDPDQDGLTNEQEALLGTDPLNWDTNGNGLSDGADVLAGLNPADMDLDGDGLTNAQELLLGTSVYVTDSDGDGVVDGLDAFPLDPARWELPSTPGDVTPPVITIVDPVGAMPIP